MQAKHLYIKKKKKLKNKGELASVTTVVERQRRVNGAGQVQRPPSEFPLVWKRLVLCFIEALTNR